MNHAIKFHFNFEYYRLTGVLWSCNFVNGDRRFGGCCCLQICCFHSVIWRQQVSLKFKYVFTKLYVVTSNNTQAYRIVAARVSNFTSVRLSTKYFDCQKTLVVKVDVTG